MTNKIFAVGFPVENKWFAGLQYKGGGKYEPAWSEFGGGHVIMLFDDTPEERQLVVETLDKYGEGGYSFVNVTMGETE